MYCVSCHVGFGYVIAWKDEGLPPQLIRGSAGVIAVNRCSDYFGQHFPEHSRLPVCTKQERDEYMAKYWPSQRGYEIELADEAMASACL